MKRPPPMSKAEQNTAARVPFYGLLVFNRAVLKPAVLARLRLALGAKQLGLLPEKRASR